MAPTRDLSIVIPAYNEESRIEPTVREIVAYCRQRGGAFELILVDDGSRDGTSAVGHSLCQEFPELKLIRLPGNHGKGYAVRTGVVNAVGRKILFADADGATPISELERLEAALRDGADVSVGSRALRAKGVQVQAKLYRHLIGRTFHQLVQWLANAGRAGYPVRLQALPFICRPRPVLPDADEWFQLRRGAAGHGTS